MATEEQIKACAEELWSLSRMASPEQIAETLNKHWPKITSPEPAKPTAEVGAQVSETPIMDAERARIQSPNYNGTGSAVASAYFQKGREIEKLFNAANARIAELEKEWRKWESLYDELQEPLLFEINRDSYGETESYADCLKRKLNALAVAESELARLKQPPEGLPSIVPILEYLYVQFPATVGHIPLGQMLDAFKANAITATRAKERKKLIELKRLADEMLNACTRQESYDAENAYRDYAKTI